MKHAIKNWVRHQPRLQPVMPMLKMMVHAYRVVKDVLRRVFISLPRDVIFLMFLPYRLCLALRHIGWLERKGKERIRSVGFMLAANLPGPRRIVMLVISDLRVDPRVQREARALAAKGFQVTVVCPAWSLNKRDLNIDWGPNIDFRILRQKAARFAVYFPHLYGREMFAAAMAEQAWAYHAHDLDMALIALLAAARKRVACVCDFHEWYSENVSYNRVMRRYRPHPFYKRWIYRRMERVVMHHASEVVTVCDSIGVSLVKEFDAPRPVRIIRNIPEIKTAAAAPADLRAELGIAPEMKIVLYQGGLGPSRNLEPVIAALPKAPKTVFVIRGPGYETWDWHYQRLAKRHGVKNRVFCLPPVPSVQVVAEARSADMGLWTLLANVGLNFKYSLPNKVFEYIAAGLPILAADLPEVRKIVDGYKIGVCFNPIDPDSIAASINQLANDPELLAQCRKNMPAAVRDLRADQEWNKLVDLYRGLAA